MNYRPRGYEPRGLAWLPHPAPTSHTPPYSYKLHPTTQNPKKRPTQMPPKTKIPEERIRTLFKQAEITYPTDPQRAQRYIDLARKIGTRNRTHLPRDLRRRVCRSCKAYLVPGANSRTRIRQRREPHVAITCLGCGHVTRIPLRRKTT